MTIQWTHGIGGSTGQTRPPSALFSPNRPCLRLPQKDWVHFSRALRREDKTHVFTGEPLLIEGLPPGYGACRAQENKETLTLMLSHIRRVHEEMYGAEGLEAFIKKEKHIQQNLKHALAAQRKFPQNAVVALVYKSTPHDHEPVPSPPRGQLVGTFAIRLNERYMLHDGHTVKEEPASLGLKEMTFSNFFVRKAHQRQGIGRAAYRFRLAWAQRVGATHIGFTSQVRHVVAHKLYEWFTGHKIGETADGMAYKFMIPLQEEKFFEPQLRFIRDHVI